ncbi:ATP-dependent zinc metalloproteaseYME1L1 [Biomphalaria glabrata]|uniref:ATP-dependent zinc metalloprotease YME1L-like n=1 Tax=Biomphalaria glabrata TaxID=6526 RepID=A0A9U8DZ68_BIOGL|nr:ATP-dependent zinc metalloprotease YME1L-like [Biomphalaria glabrata]XP_013066332.2 ATP-dependent zinc metalloprotease YME1L-like [Biomphalaria glabrata]XP_055859577.1 ATP-dependent zinc metalloprotease YME1L-like [Biomphalaria glabrata]XP_055859578.1 ATP-dependent zinc metalloprotease YME1L-like [Biomphalaria glabrata]XP_055859579.1 ATP-dependent zinc metalloprotease YME1L-like [Biomphalaria glabrata]KAI8743951.1 ATP-dependent zinc metalloprotease [Biomphalaria glabrata]
MASVFAQSFSHPQAAIALSHLSSLLSGARAMSSHKDVQNTRNRHEHASKSPVHIAKKEKDVDLLQVTDLVKILSETNVSLCVPVTDLVRKARLNGGSSKWSECHVSSNTFFENKTGFPRSLLTEVPAGPSIKLTTCDPLFRRIFNSLVHSSSQTRGFKTVRSDKKTIGVGAKKETQESFLENMLDSFNTRADKQVANSKVLSDVDPETEKKLKIAFAEGYRAKEDTASKKKWPSIRGLIFTAVVVWLIYKVLTNNVSIKTGGSLGFLNSISYEVNAEDVNVTFEDVKGAAEAKQELQDIVNFLRDPEKYTALGAKLPKGVLLVGPPGVGKTLLARAVAGEAGVPFFHASGSEFDEMFVGLGAKRIRQLFSAAKEQAPCIIFIDEFDSVGAKRTSSAIHPYANQTVNQLLNEMDGFQQNEGIIVMGATNKVDNMDKALRRPGRFDVEVTVSLPDFKGRKEIIELYISKVKKDPNVDVDKLARGTTGFSGAELENLVNQAALKAVIDGQETVTMDHLEYARDKIIMGPERKHRIPDEETNLITAYHEAGHTLVAYYTKDATPLHKVTIVPRGQSLGHTSFIDEKEIYNRTVSQLKASIDTSMGGRVAEELIYGPEKVTTGASSDLQQATRVATAMVMANGMSEKVGLRSFTDNSEISPAQREVIDSEIRRLLQESYDRAKNILKQHHTELVNLSQALMKYETLDKEEIKAVLEGKKIRKSL